MSIRGEYPREGKVVLLDRDLSDIIEEDDKNPLRLCVRVLYKGCVV